MNLSMAAITSDLKLTHMSFTDMWLWSDERNFADDLSWPPHIDNTTKKANQTHGFLKRKLRVHNKDLKSFAYKTLVIPQLDGIKIRGCLSGRYIYTVDERQCICTKR